MLRALLCISDSTFDDHIAEQQQLNSIRNFAINNNNDNQTSGILAHHQNKFLHILEGDTNTIGNLLEKITSDDRNKNMSVLLDIKINERIYSDWDLIDSHNTTQSDLLGKFLHRSIDMLPMIEKQQHDDLEVFVDEIFY